MDKYHRVNDVVVGQGELRLEIDGRHFSFPLAEVSVRLATATPDAQRAFEVSPSGYGIHWPLIDEDISIDGLLGVRHEPPVKSYV